MREKEIQTENKKWKYASLALLIALLGVSYHSYIYEGEGMSIREAREKYPLIDISRHLIDKEHFLPTLQPLRTKLRELVATEPNARISIYIEYLNTGANINLLPEDRFIPSSLSKIPIAMATMGAIEHDIWSPDQVLTLEEEDIYPVSSTLHTQPIGTKFTIKKLLEELLVRSDNTAYRILLRNIPTSEIDNVVEAIGLEKLFDENGTVTTKEYSRLFRSLYTANYLNRENSQYLLELLDGAEFKDFMRGVVPSDVSFPHKFGAGSSNNTYSDSGVVYIPNRPYLITVMVEIKGEVEEKTAFEKAASIMRAISNMSYQFFSTANNS